MKMVFMKYFSFIILICPMNILLDEEDPQYLEQLEHLQGGIWIFGLLIDVNLRITCSHMYVSLL